MTNTNEEVERIVTAFDAHLSQSAPSMDKFEKASALNFLRASLTNAEKV